MKRSAGGNSELASSENFRAAEREVSPAKQAFFYIDSALLYSRLDTALRPMLLMSAAVIPSMSEKVDLTKLPPAEVITKHLSPIVMSQNYQTDGYVTESVGPITMYQQPPLWRCSEAGPRCCIGTRPMEVVLAPAWGVSPRRHRLRLHQTKHRNEPNDLIELRVG